MPKRNRKEPRLLAQVLQAVADLKEVRGSTARKIVDQVQTAINLSKVRPKPRNVTGQVRRALKHGVRTGVLRQKSGKFRLATTAAINNALRRNETRRRKRGDKRRGGKSRRNKNRRKRVKRARSRRRRNRSCFYDPSVAGSTAMTSQLSEYFTPIDNRSNYSYYVVTGRRRRPKQPVKRKSKKTKRRRNTRKTRRQQPTMSLVPNEPSPSNSNRRQPRSMCMDYDGQGNKLYIIIFCNVFL